MGKKPGKGGGKGSGKGQGSGDDLDAILAELNAVQTITCTEEVINHSYMHVVSSFSEFPLCPCWFKKDCVESLPCIFLNLPAFCKAIATGPCLLYRAAVQHGFRISQ